MVKVSEVVGSVLFAGAVTGSAYLGNEIAANYQQNQVDSFNRELTDCAKLPTQLCFDQLGLTIELSTPDLTVNQTDFNIGRRAVSTAMLREKRNDVSKEERRFVAIAAPMVISAVLSVAYHFGRKDIAKDDERALQADQAV